MFPYSKFVSTGIWFYPCFTLKISDAFLFKSLFNFVTSLNRDRFINHEIKKTEYQLPLPMSLSWSF